ncbi:Thiamine biosynthesis lipoprotein ApbE precursor [compost metagenome]
MLKHKKIHILILLIIIIPAFLCLIWINKDNKESHNDSSGGDTRFLEQTFYIFDTVVNIKVYGDSVHQTNMDDIQHMLERMDLEFSRTKEGGEVFKINEAAGKEAITVSDETLDIVKQSIEYAKAMHGAFDPTIGPLIDLWNIGNGGDQVPELDEINKAKSLINYEDMIIDEAAKTVQLAKEGMVLDLGGIGKGYAADRIADYLKEQNLDSAMINLGGSSIIALGTKPKGNMWTIGLQDPDQSRGTQLGIIKIANEIIDSSGVYERFFIQDGVKYHHILDPNSGYPSQNGLKSITILSPNATDADALSTGVFLMGLEEGMKYLESLSGDVEGFFVTEDNLIYATSGIKSRMQLTDNSYKFSKF